MVGERQLKIPLPKCWTGQVRSAVVHVISLAQYATVYTRGWAANSLNARVRLKSQNDRLHQEVMLLAEEIRIKDARLSRISPHKRPRYPPIERMAILQLRAARGWSQQQTADAFQITAATVASWMKRLDEHGPDALVQLRVPVNRFPDLVRYLVQQLKTLCPSMGKVKIAEVLARAGLHLGPTTIGRMLKEKPKPQFARSVPQDSGRNVTSKRPNHVWLVDLTTVPTSRGFWTSWLPFALPQRWPFCWWLAVCVDHYSRRVMGFCVFSNVPSSVAIRAFLGRTIRTAHTTPNYLICDKGTQFWNDGFKAWCQRRDIKPRFGAVGKHGSIAIIERLILTVKTECCRRIQVPLRRDRSRRELSLFGKWYNEHRPHMSLGGSTPNEVYYDRTQANQRPRYEPREGWPRGSPCAKPLAPVDGKPGVHVELDVRFHAGRKHLPIVSIKRAA